MGRFLPARFRHPPYSRAGVSRLTRRLISEAFMQRQQPHFIQGKSANNGTPRFIGVSAGSIAPGAGRCVSSRAHQLPWPLACWSQISHFQRDCFRRNMSPRAKRFQREKQVVDGEKTVATWKYHASRRRASRLRLLVSWPGRPLPQPCPSPWREGNRGGRLRCCALCRASCTPG